MNFASAFFSHSAKKMEPTLVTSEWVKSRIAEGTHASKVVDCSWFLVPPSSPHRPVLAGALQHLVFYHFSIIKINN
jgi:hypothetical protein